MPIIATAGHVDHGKSTLVMALTGTDPDRWAEEKERGLTIDLGFAWTTLGDVAVGFVDVPGHERFVKNMLAGIGALDCALLAVAADSGWMPQTEEHATVLDLLDTPRGVIALTRTDLVDDETVELATLEILEEISGTALENWPIVAVSSVTGDGISELREKLAERLGVATTREPARMWIDRAFSVRGAGLVVTGSLTQGEIRVGDDLEILPDRIECRVRGLHRHDEPVSMVVAGDRTAVNIVTEGSPEVGRGQLMAVPGTVGMTSRFTASMRPSRSFDEIPKRGAFHMHIGTADVGVSIRRIGMTDGFVVTATESVPAIMADRFILRDSGRRAVVGGGMILDPHPVARPDVRTVEALMSAVGRNADGRADALLQIRAIADTAMLRVDSGGGTADGIGAGEFTISPTETDRIAREAHQIVERYHATFPLRPGIGRGELASQLGLAEEVATSVVASNQGFTLNEGAIALADFSHAISAEEESLWENARRDIESSFAVDRMSALGLGPELLHAIVRRGDLVQVGEDLAFTRSQVEEIIATARALPDGFTVSEFKDTLSMSRRQAIPTLEWLDRTGVTIRSGDGRVARKP